MLNGCVANFRRGRARDKRMADLGTEAIGAWFEFLPADVRAAFPDAAAGGDASSAALVSGIMKPFARPEEVLAAVSANQDSFIALGRAARVRFLAWFARLTYPDHAEAFRLLVDGDSTGDAGGVGKVAPVFMEDVRAIMASLGPRAARGIVDAETLGVVTGAGFEVVSDMDMRQGGAR